MSTPLDGPSAGGDATALQRTVSRLLWKTLLAGVVAGVLLLFGWSLLHDAAADAAQQRVLRSRGEESVAEVTAFDLEGKSAVVTLRYTTRGGQVVTLPDQSLSGPDDVGRRVVVWYDPEDPTRYSTDLQGDGPLFDGVLGRVLVVVGATAGLCGVALLTTAVVVEARDGSP